jgi:hypothetical protein
MSSFASYHNPDTMGCRADRVKGFRVSTSKSLSNIIGGRVWLITGEGKPRTYYLVGVFTAKTRTISKDPGFDWIIEGPTSSGTRLPRRAWVRLNDEPWFPDFRKSQGNFGFGVQPIYNASLVAGLEAALARAQKHS